MEQQGALGPAHDMFGGASEDELADSRVPISAHEDESALSFSGYSQDGIFGMFSGWKSFYFRSIASEVSLPGQGFFFGLSEVRVRREDEEGDTDFFDDFAGGMHGIIGMGASIIGQQCPSWCCKFLGGDEDGVVGGPAYGLGIVSEEGRSPRGMFTQFSHDDDVASSGPGKNFAADNALSEVGLIFNPGISAQVRTVIERHFTLFLEHLPHPRLVAIEGAESDADTQVMKEWPCEHFDIDDVKPVDE